jgi:hypothetical protein
MNQLRTGITQYKRYLVVKLKAKGYDGIWLSQQTVTELKELWAKEMG